MSQQVCEQFDANGYAILRSVVDRATAQFLSDYTIRLSANGETARDSQVPDAPVRYGAPMMDRLQVQLIPAVEKASGRSVFPTYSYFRVYRKGDALKKHKDRPACEISLSLCLGFQSSAPWPLFVDGVSGVFGAELMEGDALLYKGTECTHWREPFEGQMAAQVFLHYVDQNGPFADWRYDKRETANCGVRYTQA
jgi:hypothetical protein